MVPVFAQGPLDFLIPVVCVGYGSAILVASSRGSDALSITRLSAGHVPGLIWRIIGVSLIVSSFGDVAIVAEPSTGMLLLIGVLNLSSGLWKQGAEDDEGEPKIQADPEEDAKIMARPEAAFVGAEALS